MTAKYCHHYNTSIHIRVKLKVTNNNYNMSFVRKEMARGGDDDGGASSDESDPDGCTGATVHQGGTGARCGVVGRVTTRRRPFRALRSVPPTCRKCRPDEGLQGFPGNRKSP